MNKLKCGNIFVSRFTNPFLNLSLEHFLFKNLPVDQPGSSSNRLVLYINDPCVVTGRNQNPWKECNLPLVNSLNVPIVRRRSGGGTVVHDAGNVNFCFMTSREDFTRKKHGQLIVNQMNKLSKVVQNTAPQVYHEQDGFGSLSILDTPFDVGLSGDTGPVPVTVTGPQVKLKLNDRYDIVTEEDDLKVSGSAYKIERCRAYHHGTMLLNSRLDVLHTLLHRNVSRLGIIEGRGVDSVKSPVANIGCNESVFMNAVVDGFCDLYEHERDIVYVEEDDLNEEILAGAKQLQSWDWVYGQTPDFTHTIELLDTTVKFEVKKGRLVEAEYVNSASTNGEFTQLNDACIKGEVPYTGQDLAKFLHAEVGEQVINAIDGLN